MLKIVASVMIMATFQPLVHTEILRSEPEEWLGVTTLSDPKASNGKVMCLNNSYRVNFTLPEKDRFDLWIRAKGADKLYVCFGRDTDKAKPLVFNKNKFVWRNAGKIESKNIFINLRGSKLLIDCICFIPAGDKTPQSLEKNAKKIIPTGRGFSLEGVLSFGKDSGTKVTIDENNNILVNGLPFFPVFFWNSDFHSDVVRGANISRMNITSPAESFNTGLVTEKIFLVPARPAPKLHHSSACPNWKEINTLRIPRVRNHPQLLAYFMCDEPNGNIEIWKKFNTLLHKLDPDHPTFIRPNWSAKVVEDWKDAADIHGHGSWSPRDSSPLKMAYVLDLSRLIMEDEKPIWPVFHPWPVHGYKEGKLTSPEALRCAIFIAIIHGAKGLTFYSSRHIRQYKEFWPKNKALPSREKVLESYTAIGDIISQVQSLRNAIFAPYPRQILKAQGDGGQLHYILKGVGTVAYLIAANPSPKHEIKAVFNLLPLTKGKPAKIYDVFGKEACRGKNIPIDAKGNVTLTFEPFGVQVLRIESPPGLDFVPESRKERLERLKNQLAQYAFKEPGQYSEAVPVGKAIKAPSMDGKMDPQWKNTTQINFTDIRDGSPLRGDTNARLMYDDNALYIFARMELDPKDESKILRSQVKRHDGYIVRDHALEIFLDNTPDEPAYFNLQVNPAGTHKDQIREEYKILHKDDWNPKWESCCSIDTNKKAWNVEIKIPFRELGVPTPKPGDIWGMNLASTRHHFTWSPDKGNPHLHKLFGRIIFR